MKTRASAGSERVASVAASTRGAGSRGFAGTTPGAAARPAAGLATLADDTFGGGPRVPMIPSTWDADSPPLPDPDDSRPQH